MLVYVSPTVRWLQQNPHSNYGAFRHTAKKVPMESFQLFAPTSASLGPAGPGPVLAIPTPVTPQAIPPFADVVGCNAVMADGHVELLSRRDLTLGSGHWLDARPSSDNPNDSSFVPVTLPPITSGQPCCQ